MINGATLKVLRCFLEADTLSFSQICQQTGYATDLGGYYIRQLIAAKCITKTGRGQYQITPLGRQHIILMTPKKPYTAITAPRLCVMAIPKVGDSYVVMRRKRQPYINYAEWPAARVMPGEDLVEATHAMVTERLDVSGELTFVGFFRRIDLNDDDTVFDDKLFAVHLCRLAPDAAIQPDSEFGHNFQVAEEELPSLPQTHDVMRNILDFAKSPDQYREMRYTLPGDNAPI
jgi:hypothetical protein